MPEGASHALERGTRRTPDGDLPYAGRGHAVRLRGRVVVRLRDTHRTYA